MNLSRKLRMGCLLCLLICTVSCDHTSKHLVRTRLSQAGSLSLPGGLIELRLAENPGSFLSLGAEFPDSIRFVVFTLGVGAGLLALGAYLTSRVRIGVLRFVGLSLFMAGGMSNLLDRILHHGVVTDFVVIRAGPLHTGIFNIADVLIIIGISVIVCTFGKRRSLNGPRQSIE